LGQTPEQVRDGYIELMGPKLGTAYDVLRYDVTLIFANRSLYRQLYADPERVRLLGDVAGNFFGLLRSTLLLDIVLQMARLVDKPATCGKLNLTLQSLPSLVSDPELRSSVEEYVASACAACQAATDWRNRRLAHRDWHVADGSTEDPLPDVSLDAIDSALATFATLLNHLESHFNNGATTAYDWVEMGGADGLFFFLQRGLDAEQRDAEL
jgi:AbiU2